jgi:hypothetical protein
VQRLDLVTVYAGPGVSLQYCFLAFKIKWCKRKVRIDGDS